MHDWNKPQYQDHRKPKEHNRSERGPNDYSSESLKEKQQTDDSKHNTDGQVIARNKLHFPIHVHHLVLRWSKGPKRMEL